MRIRLWRVALGFWPRQQWLRAERLDCHCCVFAGYLGPFGVEVMGREMYDLNYGPDTKGSTS